MNVSVVKLFKLFLSDMKSKILLILLFIIKFGFSQFNNGKIIYKANIYFLQTMLNTEKAKNNQNYDFSKILNQKIQNISDKVTYDLIFDKNSSLFKTNEILSSENNKIGAKFYDKGVFYLKKNGEKLIQKEVSGTTFLITDSIRKSDWKLLNEYKIINNFKCYKAIKIEKYKVKNEIKTRKIIAWYTPEISVPFGPLGNGMLPGLILELDIVGIMKFSVSKIILDNQNNKIIKPSKGKKVSMNQFREIRHKISLEKRELLKN